MWCQLWYEAEVGIETVKNWENREEIQVCSLFSGQTPVCLLSRRASPRLYRGLRPGAGMAPYSAATAVRNMAMMAGKQ